MKLAEQTGDKTHVDRLAEMFDKGIPFLLRHRYDEVNTMLFTHPQRSRGGVMFSYWNPMVQIDAIEYTALAVRWGRPYLTAAAR